MSIFMIQMPAWGREKPDTSYSYNLKPEHLYKIITVMPADSKHIIGNLLNGDGKEIELQDFATRDLLILYFWSGWSLDSKVDLQKLEQLQIYLDKHNIRDIEIIPVNINLTKASEVQAFFQREGIKKLRVYLDCNDALMHRLGFKSLPATALIGKNNKLLAAINKPVNWSDLSIIKLLLSMDNKDTSNIELLREDGFINVVPNESQSPRIIK